MDERFLAVIPARGGSRGIPRKNIKEFLGKPLLAWTVEVARASGVFERVLLSTEDKEIARIGRAFGAEVPFFRPKSLAEDTAPTAPVIQQAVEWLKEHEGWTPDVVMILEPTSPSRRTFHIHEAARLLVTTDADSLASVSEVPHHYNPLKVLRRDERGQLVGIQGTHVRDMIHRRQELPTYYAFNGLIFACKTELVLRDPPTLWGDKVLGYVVDPKYGVDLDYPEEWALAEAKLKPILLGDA